MTPMPSDNYCGLSVNRDDDVLTLTLNRPEAANALSPALVEALIETLDSEDAIRLCVIKAEGKNFCAGFDLSDIENLSDGDLLWRFLRIEHLLQKVHHAPYPTIAFVHGHVVGAAADIFAACSTRIAAPDAKFKMPGWQFGLALGTRRLTRLVGQDNARDILIDTKTLDAQTALTYRLATDIASKEQWSTIEGETVQRARALPASALGEMFDLTVVDTRVNDIASIVETAGKPGLKQRILDYRQRVNARKSPRTSKPD